MDNNFKGKVICIKAPRERAALVGQKGFLAAEKNASMVFNFLPEGDACCLEHLQTSPVTWFHRFESHIRIRTRDHRSYGFRVIPEFL